MGAEEFRWQFAQPNLVQTDVDMEMINAEMAVVVCGRGRSRGGREKKGTDRGGEGQGRDLSCLYLLRQPVI